jgi:hypothetical protein
MQNFYVYHVYVSQLYTALITLQDIQTAIVIYPKKSKKEILLIQQIKYVIINTYKNPLHFAIQMLKGKWQKENIYTDLKLTIKTIHLISL